LKDNVVESMSSTETETVIHSDSDFATVAFLRVKSAILEDKPVDDTQAVLPPLLEDKYMDLGAIISKGPVTNKASVSSPSKSTPTLPSHIITTSLQAPWLVIGGIQASHRGEALPSIEQELRDCFKQAKGRSFTGPF
jgi:diphthine-ammonia ligase